jgi:hypothetical protein
MNTWILIGLGFGALAGTAHAYTLLRARRSRPRTPGEQESSASIALWTVGLWTLFGTYVLTLWVLAMAAYAGTRAYRLFRSRS